MAKVLAIWSSDFFDVTWKRRGAIHSTKIPTGPTGKSGPSQKVNPFFRNFGRLDRTDPMSFGPKFPKILVE